MFQVHVRHRPCIHSLLACVCGIMVREGATVLGIDMCADKKQLLDRYEGRVQVIRPRYNTLPTGASVTMDSTGELYSVCYLKC